ncbi:uncharacterized protein LOC126749118 [Anthonomus grandis grandis]|uniref:uncharacterized protein LOC126749118 n=1 Tax=Anthonomus grandis grandis TaxID=2921223 RepID=UPI0021667AA0|nr:uncharacterized protein LOC126749118 [Anthonomus grandis grandis]
MEKAKEQFAEILCKFNSSNIPVEKLEKLRIRKKLSHHEKRKWCLKVFCAALFTYFILSKIHLINTYDCILDMPSEIPRLFRSPEYCDICEGVSSIPKISNVTSEEFLEKYIKPNHPVVVADGAREWPALKLFNFDFFKQLYSSVEMNRNKHRNCQFFPYKTEFESLQEVFNMSKDRAMLKPGEKPWYIGWNNCNDEAGRYLKKFYDKPYFFSGMVENIALSWIFMGGPGHGAHMHVDNVRYPSWQAQLKGRKLWKLAPPPECYYKCQQLEVAMEPGEIIVLDTNRWYHQTIVLPGEISITIGSEFD